MTLSRREAYVAVLVAAAFVWILIALTLLPGAGLIPYGNVVIAVVALSADAAVLGYAAARLTVTNR